jgi:small-conductance mechanosensitive channel
MTWNILLALVILVVFWSLSRSMPVVLGGWVGKLAGKTATRLDDHLVEELDDASGRVALAVGLWLAWAALGLDGGFATVVATVLVLGVVATGAVLVFEALVAVFQFFSDPHEDSGREMLRPFEARFRQLAGSLVALAGGVLGLAAVGVDGALLGALALTVGLVAALSLQPTLQEFSAGLDLIRGSAWRPGMRISIGDHSGTLAAISPAAVTLDTAEGQVQIANSRALGAAVVQSKD